MQNIASSFLIIFSLLIFPLSTFAQVGGELHAPETVQKSSQTEAEPVTTSTESTTQDGKIETTSAGSEGVQKGEIEESVPTEGASASSQSSVSLPSEGSSNTRPPVLPNIDKITGALQYRYEIYVPPGRNSLTPEVSLVYHSQAKENGVFGMGWYVGIPYIQRNNKEGVDELYTENHFISSMDGELVSTTSPEYQPKVENGTFLKYEFASSTNQWTVTDKEGVVYKFGHSASTRQDNATTTSEVFKWMLEEVRDTNDNYISYEYYKDAGQIYPSKIIYTGNDTADGIFEIYFDRESRTDELLSHAPGFSVTTNYRISQIRAEVDGVWARKYDLSYTTADNSTISILDTVVEHGQDDQASTTTLPAADFGYQGATPDWTYNSTWNLPVPFINDSGADYGSRMVDFNGDALIDIVCSVDKVNVPCGNNNPPVVKINDGSGWVDASGWSLPNRADSPTKQEFILDAGLADRGIRFVDVDGDGMSDLLRGTNSSELYTYINNGTSTWVYDSSWNLPLPFLENDKDIGMRMGDIDGDGLIDIICANNVIGEVCGGDNPPYIRLNTGSGWETASTSWSLPVDFINSSYEDTGLRLVDVNGDGLSDLVHAPDETTKDVYLNIGNNWQLDPSWELPVPIIKSDNDIGMRFTDMNGDGFVDIVCANDVLNAICGNNNNAVLVLNTGTGWSTTSPWGLPDEEGGNDIERFTDSSYIDTGLRMVDVNGDGLPDVVRGQDSDLHTYLNNTTVRSNYLNYAKLAAGAETSVSYKPTTQFTNASGDVANPDLQAIADVVSNITYSNGFSDDETYSYEYEGGDYYFDTFLDRKFSGFSKATTTDGEGNETAIYFHQGNDTKSSIGEFQDDESKIGKVYRTDSYDDSGNLYQSIITKWENYDLGNDADFVKATQSLKLTYDGDASHKDTAETYVYDDATGNLTERSEWGEVVGNSDGTFSDTSSDKRATALSYAASSTPYIIGLLSQEIITDYGSSTVRDTKRYYDSLSLGNVDTGNETKTEYWATTTTYIDEERTFNSYGLVTQHKDPRDKATAFVYDAFNLYPATTTDPVSNATERIYDYSSGLVTQLTDPNDRIFETTYDGLDRRLIEKQPDIASPSTLVTKKTYAYTDTVGSRKVLETNYLNGATTTTLYTYLDGLERVLQIRKEAETTSEFSVQDFVYDGRGLLAKESLPYFSTNSSRTASTTTGALYANYGYDPLQRVSSVANAVGTTTNSYDDWVATVTDAESNIKDFHYDAYDNLVQVDERDGVSTYSTSYIYDGVNNLTKITDDAGNVRNLTYNGLGQQLTAEDLHDTADGTFGTWTYTYDDSGSVTSVVDPKSQTINFTYDDINRVLTEDYTGEAGTEVEYGYDDCAGGKGYLCIATTTDAVTAFAYNALGLSASETKTIDSTDYAMTYSYDRQGNITNMVYPDSFEVEYTYNTAGLLETVGQKESGAASFTAVVDDIDYGPIETVTFKSLGNGVESTYTYDANRLYRLENIYTVASSTGGGGMGLLEFPNYAFSNGNARIALATSQELLRLIAQEPIEQNQESVEIVAAPVNVEQVPTEETVSIIGTSTKATTDTPSVEEAATTTNAEHISNPTTPTATSTTAIEETTSGEVVAPADRSKREGEGGIPAADNGPYEEKTDRFTYTAVPVLSNTGMTEIDLIKSKPEVVFKKWDGEVSVGVSYDSNTITQKSSRAPLTDRIEWKGDKEEVHAYPLSAKEGMEDGGFEIEVYLKEVPVSNVFNFSVTGAENLEFFHQPALSEEENRHGDTCSETRCVDSEGRVSAERPENVVGSYAVYHKEKVDHEEGGINYATGKVFHIYRPKAIDANGVEIWGTLKYESGVLSVEIPQDFLVKATYPVRVDPTFGYTSIGSSQNYIEPNWIAGDRYTSPTDAASISGISWYSRRWFSGDDFKGVVYDSSGNVITNGVGTSASNPTSFSWVESTFATDPTISGSTNYGLTVVSDGEPDFKYDWTGTYELWDGSNSFASPQSIPSGDAGSYKHSIYATYTAASSSNATATPPTALQTEGLTNPTDVSDNTPEFSAIYNDPDSGDQAVHYQLQVSTSTGFTNPSWDSIKTAMATTTEGNRSPDISYSGSALASSTPYYWRVKFWDDEDLEGEWSTTTASFSLSAASSTNSAPSAPTLLETEGQTNPTDIADDTPEFSAIYNDSDTGDIATDYQIQVATSSDFVSPYWDSAKTALASSTSEGTRIADISYGGSQLASSTTYYLRVKFWDDDAAEGLWSTATSTFSLAEGETGSPFVEVLQDISFTYDNVGNIIEVSDVSSTGAGKAVQFAYDDLYRLTSASTTAASSTPFSRTYSYSPIGNITNKSDLGSYTYSETGKTNPHAATGIGSTTLAYDDNGNLTSSGSSNYTWGYKNRLSETNTGSGTTTYAYDHTNQRVMKTTGGTATVYPNQYYNTDGTTVTKHIFIPEGDLVATVETGAGGSSSGDTGYKTPSSTGSTYNECSSPGNAYVSDGNYARCSAHSATDEQDYTNFSLNVPSGATVDGIEVSVEGCYFSAGSGNGDMKLSWNGGTSLTTQKTTSFQRCFDGDVTNTYGGSTDTWGRTWTDSELNNTNFLLYAHSQGNSWNIDQIQVKIHYTTSGGTGSTTTQYIHTDHLGGTSAVTDSLGVIVESIDYYPFGAQRVNTGSFTEQRKFTGHEYDEESDLTYAKARYYAQDVGRWMSQDPMHLAIGSNGFENGYQRTLQQHLRNPQALNSYSYALNNPLRHTDPTGEAVPALILGGFAAYGWISSFFDTVDYKTVVLDYPEVHSVDEINQAGNQVLADIFLFGVGRAATNVEKAVLDVSTAGLDTLDYLFEGNSSRSQSSLYQTSYTTQNTSYNQSSSLNINSSQSSSAQFQQTLSQLGSALSQLSEALSNYSDKERE